MSAGMTVTPVLAEEATPEAAAPAETVAVDAPTFYAYSHDVKAVVMNIGAAQDSVNVTWYGSTPTGGMLKYGVQGGEMTTLQAAVAPTSSEGWYKNTVTLTGLQSNTTYEYAVSADKDEAHYGETKTYTTQTFGKDEPYTFLVFGDPQIGCSGSIDDDNGGWTNTLSHALAKAPNANFLFSMGDQINAYYKYDTSNLSQVEEEYDGFLNAPQLTQLPLATELGNHDCGYNTALYGQHFTLPNISEKYGQVSGDAYGDNAVDSESTGDGDYYFTYNNTLYMVLNTSCLSIAEHKAFLEETIQANPDVTWKVVSFHKSIYSVASHVTESDIVTLRNGLSPILSQLGIDIVLQGHDHVYARSYIMGGESGMTADVQRNADGSALTEVTNPDGVQYITMNSASGSKFYKITEEAFEYTAVQNQEKVPNYSVANVTKDAFTVTTYRSTDDSVVDTITIKKSKNGWETVDGKDYWYENGVKQGTTGRGKEIYDASSDAWYWLDAVDGGAKAVNKDVYQESDGGKWVRYDENGHMIKGENCQNGNWYYFEPVTGAMIHGPWTLPDGRKVYYDPKTGIMQYGSVAVNNQLYYFDPVYGKMTSGTPGNFWYTIDGKSYWYENWVRQGWQPGSSNYRGKEIYDPASGAWYWLDSVQQGAKAVSKEVYQDSNGGKWVRYDENGHMVKGWDTNNDGTYYFDQVYGTMAKGIVTIDGNLYLFDVDTGVMQASITASEEAMADRVIELVNQERTSRGLQPLLKHDGLMVAAAARAKELSQRYSHTRPNGSECFTILWHLGIDYGYAGENIAMGQRTPEIVMNDWMNSSGHRANILNENYDCIGVGYTMVDGHPYWVQLFTGDFDL